MPATKALWPQFAKQPEKEGWPAARLLATFGQHEFSERGRRRIARHLAEARLPPGKTQDTFDFDAVPMVSIAQVSALGDSRLGKSAYLRLFCSPGGGKSHLITAVLGLALIDPDGLANTRGDHHLYDIEFQSNDPVWREYRAFLMIFSKIRI